ncbi:DExH-box ATP-dependent RNA helicase DExH7, chloroplastic [Vitis vinifera]|uniref:DExH-box ATP-dependent RNA helicase DExH7, chloroplastic n=1 Tax=Vitis vinifera TaxID=29760 RepID=A0A438GFE3_VITVI|nr:DExH-box ATP-dependent RNA helicase DExH7, chloroplastic [Vitis vinifera]
MAPKKKQQQNKPSSSKSKSKSQTSAGPKLQISAENENRLRRLLLNSGRSGPASSPAPADDTLSKAQKAKKLRSVYEKLSCEGFSNDHIELALSALKKRKAASTEDISCIRLNDLSLPGS